ncbi:hypothetical protein [Tenacibaculum aiptasiae]|uniref:hypothetical protein n=1 Tax=Tenacibaculum aiptasiae TaxID=426481 RepID=UPI003B5A159E
MSNNPETIAVAANSSTNKKYSSGKSPSVASNSKNVVIEVHETSNIATNTLYYKVGIIENGKISWGKDHSFDKGFNPSVAINDEGMITTVHETTNTVTSSLYYRLGKVDTNKKEINWSTDL